MRGNASPPRRLEVGRAELAELPKVLECVGLAATGSFDSGETARADRLMDALQLLADSAACGMDAVVPVVLGPYDWDLVIRALRHAAETDWARDESLLGPDGLRALSRRMEAPTGEPEGGEPVRARLRRAMDIAEADRLPEEDMHLGEWAADQVRPGESFLDQVEGLLGDAREGGLLGPAVRVVVGEPGEHDWTCRFVLLREAGEGPTVAEEVMVDLDEHRGTVGRIQVAELLVEAAARVAGDAPGAWLSREELEHVDDALSIYEGAPAGLRARVAAVVGSRSTTRPIVRLVHEFGSSEVRVDRLSVAELMDENADFEHSALWLKFMLAEGRYDDGDLRAGLTSLYLSRDRAEIRRQAVAWHAANPDVVAAQSVGWRTGLEVEDLPEVPEVSA